MRLSSPAARDADLARLLRAIERAGQAIRERPREAQSLLRARLGLEPRYVQSVWHGLEFRLGLDRSLVGRLQSRALDAARRLRCER